MHKPLDFDPANNVSAEIDSDSIRFSSGSAEIKDFFTRSGKILGFSCPNVTRVMCTDQLSAIRTAQPLGKRRIVSAPITQRYGMEPVVVAAWRLGSTPVRGGMFCTRSSGVTMVLISRNQFSDSKSQRKEDTTQTHRSLPEHQ
ncbi:unnamed protein product [Anisakis simplex]|uniref:AhpC-TSA domain-containing protein n=1 Tax=Anisakis simplex TaxID=6269 RepID=A0A0M3JM20_ANISI|nr:unnamed protein product [Anisakis simplex]